jgi:hypothetical protein
MDCAKTKWILLIHPLVQIINLPKLDTNYDVIISPGRMPIGETGISPSSYAIIFKRSIFRPLDNEISDTQELVNFFDFLLKQNVLKLEKPYWLCDYED